MRVGDIRRGLDRREQNPASPQKTIPRNDRPAEAIFCLSILSTQIGVTTYILSLTDSQPFGPQCLEVFEATSPSTMIPDRCLLVNLTIPPMHPQNRKKHANLFEMNFCIMISC